MVTCPGSYSCQAAELVFQSGIWNLLDSSTHVSHFYLFIFEIEGEFLYLK
jgi:hypothetical protein